MAQAVHSKVFGLVLLIYCLMYFQLFMGVLCLYLFCFALLCVHFFVFCNHLEEEKKAGCFAIVALQMYCYYECSVALHHGVVG